MSSKNKYWMQHDGRVITLFCLLLQVAEMYRSQEQIVNQMKKKMDVDDDDMDWRQQMM